MYKLKWNTRWILTSSYLKSQETKRGTKIKQIEKISSKMKERQTCIPLNNENVITPNILIKRDYQIW